MKKKWRDFDFTLVFTPILLTCFGIVMIYSASMGLTAVNPEQSGNYFMMKQLLWFAIGLFAFIFTSFFSYRHYQKLIKPIVLMMIVLLAGVLVFGNEANGAKSWYSFGPVSFQPAEFAKLGLIIYLASVYSKKQQYISDFNKAVLPPLVVTIITLGLIVKQPDVGTAAIIFLIACSVIFSSGIRLKHLLLLGSAGLTVIAIAIPQMITDERLARFTGAYQPFEAPDTDGYHLIQSYLAIGSGGLTGEGLGQGIQKLGYLLEPHTDFIMAVIAEELGFLGVVIVIGMLATIVLRGIYISKICDDSFGSLLAIGISSMVGLQAFINLGAISGLLPITGVPLPFISYGGSSLLIMMIAMGILNNIARSVRAKEYLVSSKPETTEQQTKTTTKENYRNRGGRTWLS